MRDADNVIGYFNIIAIIILLIIALYIVLKLKNKDPIRNTLEEMTDAFFSLDNKWRFTYLNHRAELFIKMKKEDVIGKFIWDVFVTTKDEPYASYLRGLENGIPIEFEMYSPSPKDWVEIRAFPSPNGTSVYFRVITTRKLLEQELKASEEKYRKLVELSPYPIGVHKDGVFTYMNSAGVKALGGKTMDDIVGKNLMDFIHPNYIDIVKKRWETIVKENIEAPVLEEKYITLDKKVIDVEISAFRIPGNDEKLIQIFFRDITDQKMSEKLIRKMAYYDSLTGLPNRNHFNKAFAEAIHHAKNNDQSLAVLFIDLDRFKLVNDTFGHQMGDLLLKQVTIRMQSCVNKTDMISRQGGDEFIILLKNTSKEGTMHTANKLLEGLSYPFVLSGNELYITPSIGISMYPHDAISAEELIKNADLAMYEAKNKGRNTFVFFSSELFNNNFRKANLETKMRKALAKGEFELYYQPKIEIKTQKLIGFESLIRWNDPEEGMILPNEFIPIAEQSDLIISLGNWVLREACIQNKAWQTTGYSPVIVCVNLSVRQFLEKDFVEKVEMVLRETNLDPKYLNLELTESMVVMNIEMAVDILKKLKALGVFLSLDDFGQGFSSLNHLNKLPVDFIKIDKSFIWDLDKSESSRNIVSAIINVSHSLKRKVIAEGVETADQVEFLRTHGCNEVQGYYISKPLPVQHVAGFLSRKE
jgi:diguanylate cyclase (GGDEF)-like protein/PAS domain S-box-containing protein